VAVACTTAGHRAALARWLGRPELAERDPRWWDGAEAAALVAAATAALPRDEAAAALLAAGVPAVPVLTAADRAATPRFTERGVTAGGADGDGPPVKGSPMLFARYAPALRPAAPAIGEHTWEVLTGIAGLAPEEVRRLEDTGAVHCARPAVPAGRPTQGREARAGE
jgi:crotonobetainyl-CoA:carnitine CoA-transferase CaiB-like acyl-CoA transferase